MPSHQRGSGVFSSLMPSHSWPVVSVPETSSIFFLGHQASSSSSGICAARSKRGWFFGQQRIGKSDHEHQREIDGAPALREGQHVFISPAFHRLSPVLRGVGVVGLEVHQRAQHLQIGDQGIGLR